MSLSQEPVFSVLKDQFVCGYRDIEHEKWAGSSGRHRESGRAVDTTNGAGPHNVQIFVLTAEGIVLTALPGYWCSEDLASELQLAGKLDEVWRNPSLSYARKCELFQKMHIAHIAEHPESERQRSAMQGFDLMHEKCKPYSDTWARPGTPMRQSAPLGVKTTDVIMHERMARQPFVPYDQFNVQAFADYGQSMYDKHEDMRARSRYIGNHHPFGDALKSMAGGIRR